jgi:hypothetical protein
MKHWAELDPRAAADWLGNDGAAVRRQEEVNAVAIVWSGRSLPDTLEWLRKLPEDGERNPGLLAVAYELARSEPMDAFKVAEELPDGDVRDELINHTASQWAGKNPREAAAWAGKVPDEELKQRLLAAITTAWADSDPPEAAKMAASMAGGRPQEDAVVGVVQRWVQSEPQDAASWVLQFPDGQLKDTAVAELVRLWADKDQEEAGKWVSGLGPAVRDHAVAAYADKLALSSPKSAAAWAEIIGDEVLRFHQMESVGTAWKASDPEAAREWIAGTALPEKIKARILAPPPVRK